FGYASKLAEQTETFERHILLFS
ncbi:unnamed protein product, partial [Adineta steineri]